MSFPESDREVLELIFRYRGAVAGGYLRDLLAGDEIKDIDAVVWQEELPNLSMQLQELGFAVERTLDRWIFTRADHKPVELVPVEDNPVDVWIGFETAPDFDVNLLTYTTYQDRGWYSWTSADTNIFAIYENIRQKRAQAIEPDNARMLKMVQKGYTIY